MEIKKRLTVVRGTGGGDNGGRKGKGHQGTCIKGTRTKPKGGRIEGERGREKWWGKMERTVLEQQ